MTLMFVDKQEKKDIGEILAAIRNNPTIDKETLSKVISIYGSI